MATHRISLIPGDGIGPEVIDAGFAVIDAAAGMDGITLQTESLPWSAEHYLKTGETLPQSGFEHLRDETDAIFVGALGDPRVPGNEHARDILLGLRFRLDLYINFRPVRLVHPRLSPLRRFDVGPSAARRLGGSAVGDLAAGGSGRTTGTTGGEGAEPPSRRAAEPFIDFTIFRENTEGQYLGIGRSEQVGTPDERQISEEIHTRKGVTRIIEAAFEWARSRGKTRITMSDKSNAVPFHRIWGQIFAEVGGRYPDITREHRYVDALALELVREPERFQVIVANNLYGDILSDLGAGLVGGLGMAASANLHPGRPGLFEPVHGSAPPLARKNVANPMAAVLTGGLMLEELGHRSTAERLERAVELVVAEGPTTPDIGGTSGTQEVARALEEALKC